MSRKIQPEDLKFLDEVDILHPKPKKIRIGENFIIVKELPLNTMSVLEDKFKKLIRKYPSIKDIMVPKNLTELNGNPNKFSSLIDIITVLLQDKKFRIIFVKLLKYIMPEIDTRGFISSKYILTNITETEALQVIVCIWAYNFASDLDSKKKVQELAKKMVEKT